MNRRLVLVTGLPGAGKTTLAEPLAAALGMPLLAKDMIKEQLYDSLRPGIGDPDHWSRRLSAAAVDLALTIAGLLPAAVLEANLRPRDAAQRARLAALQPTVVEVYCRCPGEEAARRFATRAGRRHPAHTLTGLPDELLAEFDGPVGLGTVVEVDTTAAVDLVAVVDAVRGALDPADGQAPPATSSSGTSCSSAVSEPC
jgi:predicted kinase